MNQPSFSLQEKNSWLIVTFVCFAVTYHAHRVVAQAQAAFNKNKKCINRLSFFLGKNNKNPLSRFEVLIFCNFSCYLNRNQHLGFAHTHTYNLHTSSVHTYLKLNQIVHDWKPENIFLMAHKSQSCNSFFFKEWNKKIILVFLS